MGSKQSTKDKRRMYRVINADGDYEQVLPETSADQVTYDNSESGLTATNIQDAIGEILTTAGKVDDVQVNDTTIVNNKIANIKVDGTYDASTNKVASVSTVTNAIADLDSTLSADTGYALTGVTETDGKLTAKTQMAVASATHVHGNITNDGKIGSASGKVITTTTDGLLQAEAENTAFNKNFETSTSNIKMDGTVSVGTATTIARADHVHPTDTSRVAVADIVDDVSSTATNKPLSANQGKELNTRIDNLEARGRFLSLWDATTGLPETAPTKLPYTYKTGDYYVVSVVGATNYRPDGTTYTGVASTTVETDTKGVKVNDAYYFDGAIWRLQHNQIDLSTFVTAVKYDSTSDKLKYTVNGTDLIVKETATGTPEATFVKSVDGNTGAVDLSNTYLGKTATAADSDKLDGNDSTYFATASDLTTLDGATIKDVKYDSSATKLQKKSGTDATYSDITTIVTSVDGSSGAVDLSNTYLGKSATAVDSDKLDGQHGSYYATASDVNDLKNGTLTDVMYNTSAGKIQKRAYGASSYSDVIALNSSSQAGSESITVGSNTFNVVTRNTSQDITGTKRFTSGLTTFSNASGAQINVMKGDLASGTYAILGTETGFALTSDMAEIHKYDLSKGEIFDYTLPDASGEINVGKQPIGLTGDITGTGTTGVMLSTTIAANAVTTSKIADGNVTDAKLSTISGLTAGTYSAVTVNNKGRVTAGGNSIEWGTSSSNEPSENLMINGLFFEYQG